MQGTIDVKNQTLKMKSKVVIFQPDRFGPVQTCLEIGKLKRGSPIARCTEFKLTLRDIVGNIGRA